MELFTLHRGRAPLVIDVPHAGTYLPPDLRARLTPRGARGARHRLARREAVRVRRRRRCHADVRDAFALRRGPESRPVGRRAVRGRRQHRAVPDAHVRQRARLPRRRAQPAPAEIAASASPPASIPYHATLAAEIERVRARHGYAIVLDGHSIRSEVPRFFRGPPARPQSRHGQRRELRRRRSRRRPPAVLAERAGHDARRERPLQGRLDHAALRPAAPRRARAAARDRRALLHGPGPAVSRGIRRAPRRSSPCCAGWSTRSSPGGRRA